MSQISEEEKNHTTEHSARKPRGGYLHVSN